MQIRFFKALCGLASPGYDNPRPSAVWLRLPAIVLLFGREIVELVLLLEAVSDAAKGRRRRSARRWSYLRPEWDEGEAEVHEELLLTATRQRARFERKLSSPRGHRCGRK